jgi:leader peptidase (prepilin peptidase) / N-methyltransferase
MSFAMLALAPGLALGSFLNVVAARVPLHRSIVGPCSACMSCGHELAWHENVPLLSYAVLRGRCKGCGAHIPLRYPAVEASAALLVAGCVWKFGLHAEALVAALFCLALVAVSATDLEHRIIPNRIVLPCAAAVLVAQTAVKPSPEWAIAAVGAFTLMLVLALIYPAGMGMGDVKLALLLGAMLGWTVPVSLMVGVVSAMVPAVVLLARHGSKARKMGVPFGPFLALGAVVALFAGHPLLHIYLHH